MLASHFYWYTVRFLQSGTASFGIFPSIKFNSIQLSHASSCVVLRRLNPPCNPHSLFPDSNTVLNTTTTLSPTPTPQLRSVCSPDSNTVLTTNSDALQFPLISVSYTCHVGRRLAMDCLPPTSEKDTPHYFICCCSYSWSCQTDRVHFLPLRRAHVRASICTYSRPTGPARRHVRT